MKCDFCGGEIEYETSFCSHCGAPCKYIERPIDVCKNEEKIITIEANDPDDLRPMSSPDISFLKQSPKKVPSKSSAHAGCIVLLGVFLITVLIIIEGAIRIINYFVQRMETI